MQSITVSALNKYVKSVLESDPVLTDVAIRGEVSNFNHHYKTGHCYFSIKDEKASVPAVMFRSDAQRLAFQPANGMAVIARCRVSLFERDGKFQLYVQDLFPDGIGAAQMAFEQLKQRLSAEGLFDTERKKPLPAFPKRVGLVTSKSGAALQDILKVATWRCPDIEFILAPVTVQGVQAAPEIADAILSLQDCRPDVIIVARGGGSAEDLWVFNAEEIARTVVACRIPVVSAIGHEIDFTILDFVADLRAPTPSAAAEMVLPDLQVVKRDMGYLFTRIAENIHLWLDSWYNNLDEIKAGSLLAGVRTAPVLGEERLAQAAGMMQGLQARRIADKAGQLARNAALAEGLSPYKILARGYAAASKGGAPVKSIQDVLAGDELQLMLKDGELDCRVESIRPKETI